MNFVFESKYKERAPTRDPFDQLINGGGGGNRTRIQRLRPVKSTRLVYSLSFAKAEQMNKQDLR